MTATGSLNDSSLAAHVAACDLLMQPYPDGISSRRTTAMAGLRLGVPIVTTHGYITEPFWEASRAVRLVPVEHAVDMATQALELLANPGDRALLGRTGRDLYDRTFELGRTIAAITDSTEGKAA